MSAKVDFLLGKMDNGYMRELDIPPGVESDENATEMVRYWLANGEPNVSLLLGMYEDAEDCDVDELSAWGNILADIAQHVANGLEQMYGWDFKESVKRLSEHFSKGMGERAPDLEGGFFEDS